jgi:hypothetical protein
MGAFFSGLPTVPEPPTFTINKTKGLSNEQYVYILATYGISTRRFSGTNDWLYNTLSKHTKSENDPEFYGRALNVCGGTLGKALRKQMGISYMETCLASDYSAASYRLLIDNKQEIKKLIVFDSQTSSLVKKINIHLQQYNGKGGRHNSCYAQ